MEPDGQRMQLLVASRDLIRRAGELDMERKDGLWRQLKTPHDWFSGGRKKWSNLIADMNRLATKERAVLTSTFDVFVLVGLPITRYVHSDWDGLHNNRVFYRTPLAVELDGDTTSAKTSRTAAA